MMGKAKPGAGQSGLGQGSDLPLRILATSDLHANLLAWDYDASRPAPQRGLAQTASLIAAARAEAPQHLLLDNGDFLHGSTLGDDLAATASGAAPRSAASLHPMIAAMNHLRYDAVALGNHEFSHGLGFLRRSLQPARFPLVCSNLVFKPGRAAPVAQTSLLLTRHLTDSAGQSHRLRIGILGFLPPQTMVWERRSLLGRASVEDIVTSARLLIPKLRREGADLIIALSHSGIGDPALTLGAENASSALAALDGVDVVIAGHTHQVFPVEGTGMLAGKPAVMPGFFGSHLGVIDLRLQRRRGGWRVAGAEARVRPVAARQADSGRMAPLVAEDTAIAAIARPRHLATLARGAMVIAETPRPLHSFFALVTETLPERLVAAAQAKALAEALCGGPHADLPILSAVAPFKAGGRGGPDHYTNIPAGPLCRRHLGDLYLHPNTLTALRITGADLALWLERSVSLYRQIAPGSRDAPLIDAGFASFNFDLIHGLTWQVDLAQPARFDATGREIDPRARRIVGLCHQGRAVAKDQVFALATNNYRSAGGAGFAGALPERVIHDSARATRDILAAHLQQAVLPAPADPSWRFLPMPGTSASFETAPAAADCLADVPHLRLCPLGLLPSGFRRFRLQL